MTNSIQLPLPTDGEARLDELNKFLTQIKQDDDAIAPELALSLLDASLVETDGHVFAVLWAILEKAPSIDRVIQSASETLQNSKGLGRDSSLQYLWRVRPENRSELLKKYDEDSDPYVQNALARCEAELNSKNAFERWILLIQSQTSTSDLDEVIPYELAAVATHADLERLELVDSQMGGNATCQISLEQILNS